VHFPLPEFCVVGTGVKVFQTNLIRIVVTLALGALLVLPSTILAQDGGVDAAKRKVRTKIAPTYPVLAKRMNVEGKVKVAVTITADGRVKDARLVGGSPVLASAALDAARQWKFDPAPKDSTEVIEFEFQNPAS
jgi:TonB family protein